MMDNTPDTQVPSESALLQTPKGFNIESTPDKISENISSSNFKTP